MQQGWVGLPHPEMKQGGGGPPPGGLRGGHLIQYLKFPNPNPIPNLLSSVHADQHFCLGNPLGESPWVDLDLELERRLGKGALKAGVVP